LGFAVALGFGVYLVMVGNLHENSWILNAHIIAAAAAVAALLPFAVRAARRGTGRLRSFGIGLQAATAFALVFPIAVAACVKANPNPSNRIVNPVHMPTAPEEEGGGPTSPFFPSSAKTNVGGIIPSNFIMDSKGWGE